jgi:hypothetical protein
MFTWLRYGLAPVVYYCLIIVTASIDAFSTNSVQKSTWTQTVATVLRAEDIGETFAEFRRTQKTFSEFYGTLQYAVDGVTYTWQGRARDIGVHDMKLGEEIKLYVNPKNPREISTLIMHGAATGSIIIAAAVTFLVFYAWFFWLRGFLRRSPPDDFDGDAVGPSADRVPERFSSQIEQPRFTSGDPRPAVISNRPTGKSFGRARAATFGKR